MGRSTVGTVVVVRALPDPGITNSLQRCLDGPGTRLFLHGDGVALAEPGRLPVLAGSPGLEVCATSWRRRYADAPDSRFRSAGLASMYSALDAAQRYRVWGHGGASEWRQESGVPPGWLLELASFPRDARDRTETLEFVLGAAALDLDARVLFRGPGYNYLLTDAARGWAQLSDFNLLELICEAPEAVQLRVAARRVDSEQVESLRDAGLRRLVL